MGTVIKIFIWILNLDIVFLYFYCPNPIYLAFSKLFDPKKLEIEHQLISCLIFNII